MADSVDSSGRSLSFPFWQHDYERTLLEGNTSELFSLVEVAEQKILLRRDAIAATPGQDAERQAIADALATLGVLKRKRLKFVQ
jgi:hypothetical protein